MTRLTKGGHSDAGKLPNQHGETFRLPLISGQWILVTSVLDFGLRVAERAKAFHNYQQCGNIPFGYVVLPVQSEVRRQGSCLLIILSRVLF
jgi:hypothetical protein